MSYILQLVGSGIHGVISPQPVAVVIPAEHSDLNTPIEYSTRMVRTLMVQCNKSVHMEQNRAICCRDFRLHGNYGIWLQRNKQSMERLLTTLLSPVELNHLDGDFDQSQPELAQANRK